MECGTFLTAFSSASASHAATEVASQAKRNLDMELEAKRIDDWKKAKVYRKKNESIALVEWLCKFTGVEYS